jgi:ABC-type uncharacterized transport system ATPase subunit
MHEKEIETLLQKACKEGLTYDEKALLNSMLKAIPVKQRIQSHINSIRHEFEDLYRLYAQVMHVSKADEVAKEEIAKLETKFQEIYDMLHN